MTKSFEQLKSELLHDERVKAAYEALARKIHEKLPPNSNNVL